MNIKLTALVIFIVGAILTILGVISITSTVITSKNYKKTIGIVEKYETKRVYKHGKNKYESTMLISYETERFGKLYTTMESYYPFRKVKDELTLWYDPNKPRNIKLPFSEIAWALIFIPLGIGSILLSLMAVTIKKKDK